MHAWGVGLGVRAVEDILVQLSCKVTSEAMDLRLFLSNLEGNSVEHLHALLVSLWQFSILFSVWIGTVSEGKHWLRFIPTRIVG